MILLSYIFLRLCEGLFNWYVLQIIYLYFWKLFLDFTYNCILFLFYFILFYFIFIF